MAVSRTIENPRRSSMMRGGPRRGTPKTLPAAQLDPLQIQPARREELTPILIASLILGVLAFLVNARNGWLLLYGDAVAHMGIARRILDASYPGLAQLGGVWLPLPHVLMLPFVWHMEWWQTGLAGVFPSLAAYVLGNVGCYRLARRLVPSAWATVAIAFIALNPNLLYLSSTAMTEPLFLALLLWLTDLTLETAQAFAGGESDTAASGLLWSGALIFAMVFTRYDGWIIGAVAWFGLAIIWWRSSPDLRQKTRVAFACLTAIAAAGPILWFIYNAVYFGDWLDFMRGPYSAAAIERRTSPPGARHYRGWHNPAWSLLFYTRTAQVVAAAWETGFAVMLGALAGAFLLFKQRVRRVALLLWAPLPFYVYSVAWGSVPIFIPQLYPHSFYNSRYGMGMLPAFAISVTVLLAWIDRRLRERGSSAGNGKFLKIAQKLVPATLILIVLNTAVMMGTVGTIIQACGKTPPAWVGRPPLVYEEAVVNSRTRIPFEKDLAREMLLVPEGTTIMFSTNDHIGAVQDAGIPLKQLVSPLDSQRFDVARLAPAQHAQLIIALDGDPVAAAVKAHPEGLLETEVICHTGQPCARIYRSTVYRTSAGGAH